MQKSIYIKFFTGLLLLVFALSITPKRFLHNVFAKHIDNRNKAASDTPYQLTTSGYNCDTDNLVAESAFDNGDHHDENSFISPFSTYLFSTISVSSTCPIFSSLRGPPVNI